MVELQSFHSVFKDFILENILLHFEQNVRFGFIHSNRKIELLNHNLHLNKDFSTLILFNLSEMHVIKNKFSRRLIFKEKSGSFCKFCGYLFNSKPIHNEICLIEGKNLTLTDKLLDSTNPRKQEVASILDHFGISEHKENKEPKLFLRRNFSTKSSSSVIELRNVEHACKMMFLLYYYNEYLQLNKFMPQNLTRLLN